VPKSDSIAPVSISKPIAVVKKRAIPVQISGDIISGNCRANGKILNFVLSAKKSEDIFMEIETANKLLRDMVIEIDDLELREKALHPETGAILENSVLYLRELVAGDDYAENVKVIVKKGLPAPLLIGTDFILEEWGKYIINREGHEILFEK
jgi:hypothetical protein